MAFQQNVLRAVPAIKYARRRHRRVHASDPVEAPVLTVCRTLLVHATLYATNCWQSEINVKFHIFYTNMNDETPDAKLKRFLHLYASVHPLDGPDALCFRVCTYASACVQAEAFTTGLPSTFSFNFIRILITFNYGSPKMNTEVDNT